MPIYERRCTNCDTVFSHLSKIEDRTKPVPCAQCPCLVTAPIMSATQTDFKFADRSARKERR